MTPTEQQHVERIEDDHRPKLVYVGWLRWRRVCVLDGQSYPCNRAQLARDVAAGKRDLAGRPQVRIPRQRRRRLPVRRDAWNWTDF